MPHYSWFTVFMQEFNRLTPAQQDAFLAAVKRYLVTPLRQGKQPPVRIFHKMSGYEVYEFRWDTGGRLRATCDMFIDDDGEVEVKWRRIGGHEIYQNP